MKTFIAGLLADMPGRRMMLHFPDDQSDQKTYVKDHSWLAEARVDLEELYESIVKGGEMFRDDKL